MLSNIKQQIKQIKKYISNTINYIITTQSIGISIFILSILFNFITSLYFGWNTDRGFNLQPESIAEFICDDISLLLMGFGLYFMWRKV